MQERRDRACRVCPSTEPEQEDIVAILEIVHQKYVGVADIGFESVTKCLAEQASDRACASRERAGRLHRAEAGMIIGNLPIGIVRQCEEQLDDVRAIWREFIRRSVAAENHVLWHVGPGRRTSPMRQTPGGSSIAS